MDEGTGVGVLDVRDQGGRRRKLKSPRGLPRGDLSFAVSSVKQEAAENGCRRQPAPECLYRLLEHVDSELAQSVREQGCRFCSEGKLHRADYERKPRGGPAHWDERHSFCCDQDGCRRRHTPPSVRFLGGKVYVGFVVVLKTALHQGLDSARLAQLRTVLPDVERRTAERWRRWWRENFVGSAFWKAARARFLPPLAEAELPLGLCERWSIDTPDGLADLLRFLSPITTVCAGQEGPM